MTTSESKGRFFLQNESIRIDSHNESNRIDSNRELECSTKQLLIFVADRVTEEGNEFGRVCPSVCFCCYFWTSCPRFFACTWVTIITLWILQIKVRLKVKELRLAKMIARSVCCVCAWVTGRAQILRHKATSNKSQVKWVSKKIYVRAAILTAEAVTEALWWCPVSSSKQKCL